MATNCPNKLSVVSYNIHGLNQGAPGIKQMIDLFTPDIFLIQEHWLTTDNLTKLHCLSDDYFAYRFIRHGQLHIFWSHIRQAQAGNAAH